MQGPRQSRFTLITALEGHTTVLIRGWGWVSWVILESLRLGREKRRRRTIVLDDVDIDVGVTITESNISLAKAWYV
jgi:hypothetical protein